MFAIRPENLWHLFSVCALVALAAGCSTEELPTPAAAHVSFRPAMPVSQPAVVEQWSGWRGGTLHGVSPAKRLPTMWSDEQNVLWRVEVPGSGNSSPIVWEDSIFVTSVIGSGDDAQAAMLCYDRTTGESRWQQPVGKPQGNSHSKNGYASATPVTDGERVFASFGPLGLAAFDFSGNLAWHVPLAQQKHEWGAASSPLLFGDTVIHIADGDTQSVLIALDQTSGQEVWRTPRASRGSWTSPVLVNAGSATDPHWELIVNGTGAASGSPGEVIAYDPSSGKELWKVQGTSDIPCPTAIAGDNLIISSSGTNGPIFALRPGETNTPRKLWSLPSGGPYVPTGIIYQNQLFLVSDSGQATCHRLDDGEIIWKKRLQGAFSASLVAGGGNIYAVSERGDVYVFKAGATFELVTTNRMREPCLATPAIVGDEILLRTQHHLYCLGETHLAATAPADISPAVEPGSIKSPADTDPSTLTAP